MNAPRPLLGLAVDDQPRQPLQLPAHIGAHGANRREVAQAASDVVISQVYGGGGNSGATLKNDFIELFNLGGAAVNVTGWSVQYGSATGTTWSMPSWSADTARRPSCAA